jgi:hypothetical protein
VVGLEPAAAGREDEPAAVLGEPVDADAVLDGKAEPRRARW